VDDADCADGSVSDDVVGVSVSVSPSAVDADKPPDAVSTQRFPRRRRLPFALPSFSKTHRA
jgi:hypothetical protein